MDQQRRSFLTLFSAAFPAAVAAPFLLSNSIASTVENKKKELWEVLADIKALPSQERTKEMYKLEGQWVELGGFLNDAHDTVAGEHKYILSPNRISCCVECAVFGSEPFVFVDAGAKIPSYTEQVNIRGQLKLVDKSPIEYLHRGDAQIAYSQTR